MTTETGFTSATAQKTAKTVQYGSFSDSIAFTIEHSNVRVNISAVVDDDANAWVDGDELVGDLTVTYTLTSDEITTGSIDIEYSFTFDGAYSNCTRKGSEGEATTPLAVSSGGTSHTYVWDTATDLGDHYLGPIYIRIRGFDRAGMGGDFSTSNIIKLSINNAPAAPTLTAPTDGNFGKDTTLELQWAITDPVAGNAFTHFKVEADTDTTFNTSNKKTWESRLSQDRLYFYYNDGSNWVAVPDTGIDIASTPALIGNGVKFIIPTEDRLERGKWNFRVAQAEVV